MAEFVRGGPATGIILPKEKLQGSPSTGSDEGHDGAIGEEFDPFLGDVEEVEGANVSTVVAPPENLWYHGRLDRYTAEERLWQAAKMGSYLVRESDRKPGSYVLSYLGRTGINHFRITAVCGDFYIGGRQFDSLSDLIGYYTSCSDLLKRERLMHPVPPPEPVNDKKRIVAILPYTKMPDTDELRTSSDLLLPGAGCQYTIFEDDQRTRSNPVTQTIFLFTIGTIAVPETWHKLQKFHSPIQGNANLW